VVALIAVGCSSNANEEIEADEFFRPGVSSFERPTEQAADEAPDGAAEQTDAPEPFEPEGEPAAPAGDDGAPVGDPADDNLELAEDIVRRYLSVAYGYSLELVCGGFCNATSNALDRVGFLSDDRTSVINIEVLAVDAEAPPSFEALEAIWAARNVDNESFRVETREETVLPADGVSPALLFEWTIDRRAVGGFQERYKTLITVVGPIAYLINGGGIAEAFLDSEPFVTQALESFLARPNPPSLPGTFSRWDFAFAYDVESFSGEIGSRTPTPSFDSGVFIQQGPSGQLEMILSWDSIGEALFSPDNAIDQALATGGGSVAVDEQDRGDVVVGGETARFAVIDSIDPNGVSTEVLAFAWYCGDSGRSFVLQLFNPEGSAAAFDPESIDFSCTVP
jgi:hypothetical protein